MHEPMRITRFIFGKFFEARKVLKRNGMAHRILFPNTHELFKRGP